MSWASYGLLMEYESAWKILRQNILRLYLDDGMAGLPPFCLTYMYFLKSGQSEINKWILLIRSL